MFQKGDVVTIKSNDKELVVKIFKINLDGTFEVETDEGEILRTYRENIKE